MGEIFAFESTTAVLVSIDEANILMVRFSKHQNVNQKIKQHTANALNGDSKCFVFVSLVYPLLVLTLDPSARSTQY